MPLGSRAAFDSPRFTNPRIDTMHPWLFLGVALAFAQNALATNQFRRPAADGPTGDYSENPAYEVGKDITFLWDTDFDQIDLVVWSDASDKLKTSLYKRLAGRPPKSDGVVEC